MPQNAPPQDLSLSLADPNALVGGAAAQPPAQQAAPKQRRKPVSGLDGIVNAFSDIEDPMVREMAKGLVETEMSRALGFKFKFPNPEELQMQELERQQQLQGMRITAAKQATQIAKAAVSALPAQTLAQYGLTGKEDIDDIIESNPDLFLGIVRDAGVEMTRFELALGGEDVRVTAKETEERAREKTEQVAKDLGTRESTLRSAIKIPELTAEFDPESRVEAILSAVDQETGQDIFGVGDSAIDEPRGSVALFSVPDRIRAENPGDLEPIMLEEFLKVKGPDIADALEELVDENGEIRLGETFDVSAEASFWLVNLLQKVAIRTNQPLEQVIQKVGLKAKGVNNQDMLDAWLQQAPDEVLNPTDGSTPEQSFKAWVRAQVS